MLFIDSFISEIAQSFMIKHIMIEQLLKIHLYYITPYSKSYF